MKKSIAVVGAAIVVAAGCAAIPASQDLDRLALQAHKNSFRDEGIAKIDRINQDFAQSACSSDKAPSAEVAKRVEAESLATIKLPAGGQYLGDWREGEKLAQSGRGMTWTDESVDPKSNGANCYNCHEISKAEISFGTIGPSLWNYGKIRGVKDPADPASSAVVQYTWGKLWNSKAYTACSNMPRFGHMGILNEEQIRHLMALLLDPKSPVNQ